MDRRGSLSAGWRAGLVVACVALVLLLGVPWLAREAEPIAPPGEGSVPPADPRPPLDADALEAVRAALAPPAGAREVTLDALADGIVRVGPAALPVALAMLCGEVAAPDLAPETGGDVDPRAVALRADALRAAIERFPAEERVRCMAERAIGAPLAAQRALVVALGAVDHPEALRALVRVAASLESFVWEQSALSTPFEEACARRLRARPEAAIELRAGIRKLEPEVLERLAFAAARVASRTTLSFAIDLLGRDDATDIAILGALATSSGAERIVLDDEALESIRRRIGAADPAVRRAAIDASGVLRDGAAARELLAALESEETLVAEAGHRALVRISGQERGRTPRDWILWIEEEEAWRERELGATLAELDSRDPGVVLAALRRSLSHPLSLHDAANAMTPLVESEDEAIASAVLDALLVAGSERAVAGLVDSLDRVEPERAERVHAVLVRLTGMEVPASGAAWRVILED